MGAKKKSASVHRVARARYKRGAPTDVLCVLQLVVTASSNP